MKFALDWMIKLDRLWVFLGVPARAVSLLCNDGLAGKAFH